MEGHLVERKGGWDTHGLPVEIEVQKQLNLMSNEEIEAYGMEAFNQKCKESVWTYEEAWREMSERMAFWVDMERRYGENTLPLALSAYNAGPTRARRWKQFEESGDPLRFTERIPFDETRGYVKNITRNIHLYKFLYQDD